MKHFYLVVDRVDTENCGIGTYVGQMLQCLKREIELSVTIVELDSSESELKEIEVDGLKYLKIPLRYKGLYRDSGVYYRTVAYLLCTMMDDDKINIFHFNYLHQYDIAYKMKELCPKAIIWVTVHFVNWVLALKGNVDKLHSLLREHILKESLILKDYIDSGNMLRLADKVIFLSIQTQKTICDEYKLDMCKSVVIANGIADYDIKISKSVRNKIRNSFGFLQNDRIILYSGRLEEGKGVDDLIGAFLILLKKMPACRLVIAGSGDFNRYFHLVRFCSRITFVGKLNQKELYKIYQIADVGVLLSFTEQCSYTIIEMLMFGLPIIGTTAPGLSEMFEDGIHGINVSSG
ncbi:TIGR04157 family glycosyltransferase [Bacteroides fragilis]|uniref:TIGR04157 family glycosyltransferase n=1 Tax=Bacteroides fragilis TaxID=817 RepID=UPI00202FD58E|nr:TIGR04157 family glycosyltransferase [Bacteroides fragilis]